MYETSPALFPHAAGIKPVKTHYGSATLHNISVIMWFQWICWTLVPRCYNFLIGSNSLQSWELTGHQPPPHSSSLNHRWSNISGGREIANADSWSAGTKQWLTKSQRADQQTMKQNAGGDTGPVRRPQTKERSQWPGDVNKKLNINVVFY